MLFCTLAQIAALVPTGGGTDANVTALGNSQSSAYPITKLITIFDTVAADTGGRLPAWVQNLTFQALNRGVNTLSIYPHTGETIEDAGADNAVPIVPGGSAWFIADTPGLWRAA